MFWETEADGSCIYLSREWYEFTGQTPETGLGLGWLDATHPDDRDEAASIFADANERVAFRLTTGSVVGTASTAGRSTRGLCASRSTAPSRASSAR